MKRTFLLIGLFAVSSAVFAQLRLDNQGKTILGNYNASTLECRGGAIFSRWNAEWCKIHLDWTTTNGAAHLYCTSENFTVGPMTIM
ncbi:MAG: hypothetical protein IK025_03665 [Bacteroidales bacterium]|nr:hypothetical protein [Bacteroidales bacterium]